MSKNWFPGHKPNVPQPPYSLQPQAEQPTRYSSQGRLPPANQNQRAAYQRDPGPSSQPMQRQPSVAQLRAQAQPYTPEQTASSSSAPSAPADEPNMYYNPHQTAYHSAKLAPVTNVQPLRVASAEERRAYIAMVDARNQAAAQQASSPPLSPRSGIKDLVLPQRVRDSLQAPAATTSAPSDEPMQQLPTPPADDDALREYMATHYNNAPSPQVPQDERPDDGDDAMQQLDVTASSSSALTPTGVRTPAAEAAARVLRDTLGYADTAHNVDPSFRIAATATYDAAQYTASSASTPAPASAPEPAPAREEQPQVSVQTADGQPLPALFVPADAPPVGLATPATIEVYSNGQVVARISLPWPGYAASAR